MAKKPEIKYIFIKKIIYIIKIGPLYLWNTAASTRTECIQKAFKHFKVDTIYKLKIKRAEICILQTKEIKFN
jgi:hypothetical protein